MFSMFEILPDELRDVVILDIGAMEEGQDRYHGLAQTGRAKVIGVEPNPVQREKLESSRGSQYRYIPYFLGDGGEATIHITRYHGCISLLEPNPQVINLFTNIGTEEGIGNFRVERTQPIKTIRLDDVDTALQPDFIKVDVQGGELNILKHGVRTLSSALIVESEVEFLPVYKDQPLFCDIQAFMRDQGFHLHKLLDIAGRTLRPHDYRGNRDAATSQVLWADGIFLRDFTRLDLYSDEQLLFAAVLLHDVYRSFDVAIYMLKEYDVRTGGDLMTAYGQKISQVTPEQGRERLYMNLKEFS